MNYKSLHSRRTRLAIIGVVLALCIAASATAYFLLRPHSKTVAQVNGVTITQADLDSQTAFPLAQTPGIFDSSGGAASKKDILAPVSSQCFCLPRQ